MSAWSRLQALLNPAPGRLMLQVAPVPAPVRNATPRPVKVAVKPQAKPDRHNSVRPIATSGSRSQGLEPAGIAALLRRANQGDVTGFCELVEEIEDKDLHLVSVLGNRKRAVANLGWDIEPGGPRARDRKAAEFCKAALNEVENLEDGFVDLLDAVAKGFAVCELDWYSRAGRVGLTRMMYRPQRWFRPDRDDPDTLRLLDMGDTYEGVELQPHRFLCHVSKAKSGFPATAALGRPLVWWWLFKNYAVKDWVSYGELFGTPLRLGRYPAGAKSTDIDLLMDALTQLGVDSAACIPADMQVEFVGDKATRSGPEVFRDLVELCDRAFSKGVLGQTLTTEEGRSGSRALGQVHDGVRRDLVVSDAKQLARSIKRGILAPLCRWNLGDVAVPSLVFRTDPPADKKTVADGQEARGKVFALAAGLGVPVPVSQVQEELGLRLPVDGEELLPPPASKGGLVPNAARPRHLHVCAASSGELPPHLRQVEQLAEDYLTTRGLPAWKKLIAALRDGLSQADDLQAALDQLVTVVSTLDLEPLAGAISDATLTAELVGRLSAKDGADAPVAGLPKLPPKAAAAWWTTEKKAVTPAEFASLSAEHKAAAFSIAGWSSLRAVEACKAALGQVIADGGTFDDWEDVVNAEMLRHGLAPKSPWSLQNIFRTNVSTAYAVGRDREMRQPDALNRRPYFQYRTAGDSRVRPAHQAMEGKVYPASHAIWNVWTPPNGYQCRCWITAHSADEVAALGLEIATDLPIHLGTGRPLLPDDGFQRNPAEQSFDWSRFPESWKTALNLETA